MLVFATLLCLLYVLDVKPDTPVTAILGGSATAAADQKAPAAVPKPEAKSSPPKEGEPSVESVAKDLAQASVTPAVAPQDEEGLCFG